MVLKDSVSIFSFLTAFLKGNFIKDLLYQPFKLFIFISQSVLHLVVPAYAADKTVWVVRPSQSGHNFSSDVLVAAVTLSPVEPLVVLRADVLTRVVEETRVHQVTAAH